MHRMETVKQSGLWSSLGSHGYYVFTTVVIVIVNHGLLDLWSKFGDLMS